jgi:hypothetical protein
VAYQEICVKMVALEPIAHGDVPPEGERDSEERKGAVRRLPVAWRDPEAGEWKIAWVPAVSGNSIRGMTRRRFAAKFLLAAGIRPGPDSRLDRRVAHLLFAGGSTGKGESDGGELAPMMLRIPPMALLGGSLRGAFIPGRLCVGTAWPVCGPTMRLFAGSPFLPELGRGGMEAELAESAWERGRDERLTARYVRFRVPPRLLPPDPEEAWATEVLARHSEEEVEIVRQGEEAARAAGLPAKAIEEIRKALRILENIRHEQMPYPVEAIPAGTILHQRWRLTPPAPEAGEEEEALVAAYHAFLETFLEIGRIGGCTGKGYGLVDAEARFADGVRFHEASRAGDFWAAVRARATEIREALRELGEAARKAASGKGKKGKADGAEAAA